MSEPGTFSRSKLKVFHRIRCTPNIFLYPVSAIEEIFKKLGKIIAVGTTTVRTLESLYWLGVKVSWKPETGTNDLFAGQWEPYSLHGKLTASEALESLLT